MDTNAVGSSKAGASADKIAAVEHFRESDLFTADERVALAFAEGMTRTPADVTDEVFADAQRHFSTEQLVESQDFYHPQGDQAGQTTTSTEDQVTEASMESFPASDPPAWIRDHV